MNKKLLSLKKDGNQWCVLWGENLQEGIAGFGDTIEIAMQNFINEYNTKDECDACMKQEFTEDYLLQQKAINTLNDSGLKLMEENKKLKKTIEGFRKGYADLNNYSDKLKQQLSGIKTLNRQEMAEFIKKHQNLRIKLNDYVKKIIELEDKIQQLEKVNAELKKQVNGNLEYIDQLKNKLKGYREPVITSPITEDDIVEVLRNYHVSIPAKYSYLQIAKEILGKGDTTSQK